jgi:hypothetical protein
MFLQLALALACARVSALPIHSWATTPSFFHSSQMSKLTYNSVDVAFIASHFPAVTIEKWMGCNSVPGCYVRRGTSAVVAVNCPTQEDATLATARLLKLAAPHISVSTWTDSMRIYSQPAMNPSIENKSDQDCVRNVNTPFLETHTEYLLKNATGGLALDSYIHAHVYDHTKSFVRDFWRDACLNMTATGLIDGCGADASQQNGTTMIDGLTPAVDAAWSVAHVWAVGNATAAVAAQGHMILGKLQVQLGVSTNGVLQEGCVAGNATIKTLRLAAAKAVADNTRYVYECHSNGVTNDLAAFLIGAGVDHYFGFGGWVDEAPVSTSHWHVEMGYPLGAPVADATYDASTATWSRAFSSTAGLTNVTFNAIMNTGTIAWASTQALL